MVVWRRVVSCWIWRKLVSLNLVRKACMFASGMGYLNLEGERLLCGVRDMRSMNCGGNCRMVGK